MADGIVARQQDTGAPASARSSVGRVVLSLASTVAGRSSPVCLARFRAEVPIKVRANWKGDASRSNGQSARAGRFAIYGASILPQTSASLAQNNASDEGRALASPACAERADYRSGEFRPGTLDAGLAIVVHRINPGFGVLVRDSGFVRNGPNSQRPGYGVVCEAFKRIARNYPTRSPSRRG